MRTSYWAGAYVQVCSRFGCLEDGCRRVEGSQVGVDRRLLRFGRCLLQLVGGVEMSGGREGVRVCS